MPAKRESLYPKDWFEKAKSDLRRVRVLLADNDTEGAGFHLQQAVEKYLKGYLLSRGWKLERIHDLPKLLNYAKDYDVDFERFRELCEQVVEYYTPERYPFFEEVPPTEEEIVDAMKRTERLVEKIEREVK